MTYDAHESEIEIDESAERHLFALRARASANDVEPPALASVLAAIERDAYVSRARRTTPRLVVAAFAVAACTAALFATARALSPSHERIVAERGDASAPSAPPRAVATEGEGTEICTIDRSIAEPTDDTCAAASPAPLASYAALEPMCIGVASFGAPSVAEERGPRFGNVDESNAPPMCASEALSSNALP